MEVGEELYDAKMRVLGEMIKQHIKEEEDELFPELEAAKVDLNAVGEEIAERKEELTSESKTDDIPVLLRLVKFAGVRHQARRL
jgi:hemerythrin-like domain-containing protein